MAKIDDFLRPVNFGTGLLSERFNTICRCTKTYTTAVQAKNSDANHITREKLTFIHKSKLFFSDNIFDRYLLLTITSFSLETSVLVKKVQNGESI